MINLFTNELKDNIKHKLSKFIKLTIFSTLIYISIFIFLLVFHNSMLKIIYILLNTVITTIFISIMYILIRSISYYKKLNRLTSSKLNYDTFIGTINKIDSYSITINGLSYIQYELVHEIKQVIYVLEGLDISDAINKTLKVNLINNILYSYEVPHEQ